MISGQKMANRSEQYRESYHNACRVIVSGSRCFFDYGVLERELDILLKITTNLLAKK